jgi:glycosyltransferase involved in cell wall biosynthesis
MSGSPGLSVCVIACNEERELPRCLDSVAFADELVIVIDAKSTDRSEAIARERATRVEVRPYEGDIEQKGYAASLATREWVLVIDPDERARPELARAIEAVVRRDPEDPGDDRPVGYELDRLTRYLGRWIRHGDFYPDWTLRLFRRDAYRWAGANPHGRIEVDGPTGRLDGVLEHYSYRDLADHFERVQRWSSQAARALHQRGRRAHWWDLALRPLWRSLRGYVLKRGLLDGVPGLVIACANGAYVFLKYAKLWELERAVAHPASHE